MHPWLAAAAGGILIGVAAAVLLLGGGRIAGVSGIFAGALRPGAARWQWGFVLGLVVAGLVGRVVGLPVSPLLSAAPFALLGVAGLLVGIGTRMGHGCTSGHGVCGLGNLSPRSAIAVAIFMVVAAATVFVTRHVLAPA